MFAILALADGGLLFGKKAGLVKGAFKTLFKQEKAEPQHCEIKWEDVWKPHCTTTYEKVNTVHISGERKWENFNSCSCSFFIKPNVRKRYC